MKYESKVLIGGEVFTLRGDESEEYIHQVAHYLNKKLEEVRGSDNGKTLTTRLQNVLLSINIADDYFKAKETIERLEKNHLLDLRNQEELRNQIVELKAEISRLEEQKSKVKKELDDYIELFEQDGV